MRSLIKRYIKFPYSNKENTKFKDSFDRLYVSIYEQLQPPETIEWFPTYRCNSNCRYCGGYDKETIADFGKIVPYEEIIKIVELSGKTGTTTWNIGGRGGEPLLYRSLIDILEAIKKCNIRGILITNGILLNGEFISRLAVAKWDIIRISLDSHIAAIHDEIRGVKNNFDRIDEALMLFKKFKKENNTNFPNVMCCPVITNENYKDIVEFIEYCIKKGVNEIQLMPLIGVHQKARDMMLSDEQKEHFIDLLDRKISENRIRHNIGFIVSLYKNDSDKAEERSSLKNSRNNELYCIHLWKTLVISEDGYLSPCSLIKDKMLKIRDSHIEVWNSEEMNKLRKKVLNQELIDFQCKECCGPLRNETYKFNRYLLERNNLKEG